MKKTKKCKKCQKRYPITNYHKHKSGKDGYRIFCKYCIGESKRKIYEANRDRFVEYKREYRKKNIEKLRQQNNDLKARKKDQINKRRNEIRKLRKKTDINFKLIETLRSRVVSVLKGKYKSAKTIELLGCSIEDFKSYIENKFQPGMTWENHGLKGWHLDHILPCSSFDLTKPEEQRRCFHYTNIQPLWWRDNLIKGNKIIS